MIVKENQEIKTSNLVKKYTLWVGLVFLGFFLYLYFLDITRLHFDAGSYWDLGDRFFQEGKFSLLHYYQDTRGYLLPLIFVPGRLLFLSSGFSPILFSKLTGAFFAALTFGYALPRLWELISRSGPLSWGRRALFAFLGFALWSDYFAYTLSDFPAILTLALSLVLIFERPVAWRFLLAGLFFAASINIRPMYLILVPVMLGLVMVVPGRPYLRHALKGLLPFIIGFWLVSLPQLLINYQNLRLFSPFMQSEYNGRNLYLSQLEWGITMQKYETSVGTDYPVPQMVFVDPVGLAILEREKGTAIESVGDYVKLVLKYPADFGALYLRHLFNGLDIQYKTPYIAKVKKFVWPVVLLNYTVIFLALTVIFCRRLRPIGLREAGLFLIILLPCLLVVPTAIEVRFMLPLHLFFYGLVCFGWPAGWLPQRFPVQTNLKFAVLFLIFLLACFAMSANTQVNLEHGPRLIGL